MPFELAGKRHDLAQLIGRGVTQSGTASATQIGPPPMGYDLVIPVLGLGHYDGRGCSIAKLM